MGCDYIISGLADNNYTTTHICSGRTGVLCGVWFPCNLWPNLMFLILYFSIGVRERFLYHGLRFLLKLFVFPGAHRWVGEYVCTGTGFGEEDYILWNGNGS